LPTFQLTILMRQCSNLQWTHHSYTWRRWRRRRGWRNATVCFII